jgi:hypothetical protein
MKRTPLNLFILFGAATWVTPSSALTFEIHAKKNAITTFELPSTPSDTTIGALTVQALTMQHIPFEGSESGIATIYGEGSHLEVINDKVLKAWGWCYSIDGDTSDKMPDQVILPGGAKVLKWFYSYALYDSGTWTGYCIQDK